MIAVAGYLNYSGKLFGESSDGTAEANADLANQELLDISQEDIETGTEDIESNDSEVEGTPGEAVLPAAARRRPWHRRRLQENRCAPRIRRHSRGSSTIRI